MKMTNINNTHTWVSSTYWLDDQYYRYSEYVPVFFKKLDLL